MKSFEFGMTKKAYDNFVKENGRTPTQDPIYNHEAGHPRQRAADIQPSFVPSGHSVSAEDPTREVLEMFVEDGNLAAARNFIAYMTIDRDSRS